MSRTLVLLLLIVVLLVGGMFFLAGQAKEKPQTRVEKVISLENLSK